MQRLAAAGLVVVLLLAGVSGCSFREKCAGMGEYKNLEGQTVSLLGPKSQKRVLDAAMKPFRDCTHAEVLIDELSANKTPTPAAPRLASGQMPDVALIEHGLLKSLGSQKGVLQAAPNTAVTALEKNFADTWQQVMSVDGVVYGVPVNTEMKSLVWYSPAMFKKKNLSPPQSWEDLKALTRKIHDSQPPAGTKAWCAGFASETASGYPGETASGWPGTDWIEDILLRLSGTDVYDQWVDHTIDFDDVHVVEAANQVSSILRKDEYVNGGLGSSADIGRTPIFDAGLPILSDECYLHRQMASYPWPRDVNIAPDGDVWAFHLPAKKGATSNPILGSGDIAALFSAEPKAKALQTYFATTAFADARASVSNSKGWVTANQKADLDTMPTQLDKQVSQWLRQDDVQFRYDGSDEMPDEIAHRFFWNAVMEWIKGKQSSAAMLGSVQTAWQKLG